MIYRKGTTEGHKEGWEREDQSRVGMVVVYRKYITNDVRYRIMEKYGKLLLHFVMPLKT